MFFLRNHSIRIDQQSFSIQMNFILLAPTVKYWYDENDVFLWWGGEKILYYNFFSKIVNIFAVLKPLGPLAVQRETGQR